MLGHSLLILLKLTSWTWSGYAKRKSLRDESPRQIRESGVTEGKRKGIFSNIFKHQKPPPRGQGPCGAGSQLYFCGRRSSVTSPVIGFRQSTASQSVAQSRVAGAHPSAVHQRAEHFRHIVGVDVFGVGFAQDSGEGAKRVQSFCHSFPVDVAGERIFIILHASADLSANQSGDVECCGITGNKVFRSVRF